MCIEVVPHCLDTITAYNTLQTTLCLTSYTKSCHLNFQLTMYSVLIMALISIAWTQEISVAPYKKLFVDLHNEYRQQEGSSNMQEIVCIITKHYAIISGIAAHNINLLNTYLACSIFFMLNIFLNNSLYKGYVLLSLAESISNILKRKYSLFF